MNIKTISKKKIMGISFFVNLIVISLSVVLVVSQASNTFIITSGVYPLGSATVWYEGSDFYAKNYFGVIVTSGTNPSTVINYALVNYYDVILTSGTYTLTTPITINDDTQSLKGSSYGNVILQTASAINIIEIKKVSGDHIAQIEVENLVIIGADSGTDNGIYVEALWYSKLSKLNIKECYRGIYLNGVNSTYSGGHVTLEDIEIENCLYTGVEHVRHYSSVFRHVSSHNNDAFGFMMREHAQGLEMYGCFASGNVNTGLYIVGVATGYIQGFQASDNDYGIRMRDASNHWTLDNVYIEASQYHNFVIEGGTNSGTKYLTTDITVCNSVFVKAQRNGIQIVSNSGYNTTQIRFTNVISNNNGLETDDTYYGVYIGDDGSSKTTNIYFSNCWIGNDVSWGVNNYQRGLASGSNSDYVQVDMVDTQTAKTVGISLVGTNNHCDQSWNLTNWVS